jgi:hypothetical protein
MSKTTKLQCSSCGADATASCDCGVAYVPAGKRAEEAVAANPEKSDRAIAEEIGVSQPTVSRARKRSVDTDVSTEKRTGKDGKKYKVSKPKTKPQPKAQEQQKPDAPALSLSMSAQQKLDIAIREATRKLELEFEQRVRYECRKRIEETILPHYNETYAIYKDVIKGRKGIMDRATYRKILARLHPDCTPDEVSKKRQEEAFHFFSQLEKRLLDEKQSPTPTMKIPRTYEEMMALKRKMSEARKAKREHHNGAPAQRY